MPKTPPQTRYYPQHSDPRLTEDFRIIYDQVYQLQDKLRQSTEAAQKPGQQGSTVTGGPSTTKIAGLNVHATPPTQGNHVTSMSKIPTLAYNAKTGEIEWFILP